MRMLSMKATMLLAAGIFTTTAYTFSTGPAPGRTGAPGEGICRDCHNSFVLNEPGGSVIILNAPESYVPGQVYTLQVRVSKPEQTWWGFELTAKTADGGKAGNLIVTDNEMNRIVIGERNLQYIEHTFLGTGRGKLPAGQTWSFDWEAPAAGTGDVTFYAAGNAANGSGDPSGDFIYTTSFTSKEGAVGPAILYGDMNGDAAVNLQDVTLLLRIIVGSLPTDPALIAAGDVAPVPGAGPREGQPFGDGAIRINDATRILRRVVGLETDF